MRLVDVVSTVAGDGRLVDLARLEGWPEHLDVVTGTASDARAGDVVVVTTGGGADGSGWREIPTGCTVVIVVDSSPADLPVGRVLGLLGAGGLQAMWAAPTGRSVAVVTHRTDSPVPLTPYLQPFAGLPEPDGVALRRILSEQVLLGLRWRAVEVAALSDQERRRAAEASARVARAAESQAIERVVAESARADRLGEELASAREAVARIRSSRSYRLVRSVARAQARARERVRGSARTAG